MASTRFRKLSLLLITTVFTCFLTDNLFAADYCHSSPKQQKKQKIHKSIKAWHSTLNKLKSRSNRLEQIAILNEFIVKYGLPIYSGRLDTDRSYSKLILIAEVPCGENQMAFTKRLNPSKRFIYDEVFEVNEDGQAQNRWLIPNEALILAVSGKILYVKYTVSPLCDRAGYEEEFVLAVDTSGRFKFTDEEVSPNRHDKDFADCGNAKPLSDSDYQNCLSLPDKVHKTLRRIVYESPCT